MDGIHGTPSDSTRLPSLFAGTDIRLAISSCCKRPNQISGIKRLRAKAIRKANGSVEKTPRRTKGAEVSIKALPKPKTRYTERGDA